MPVNIDDCIDTMLGLQTDIDAFDIFNEYEQYPINEPIWGPFEDDHTAWGLMSVDNYGDPLKYMPCYIVQFILNSMFVDDIPAAAYLSNIDSYTQIILYWC